MNIPAHSGYRKQGRSTLSTCGELKQPFDAVESGSISVLRERPHFVDVQDIEGETAQADEYASSYGEAMRAAVQEGGEIADVDEEDRLDVVAHRRPCGTRERSVAWCKGSHIGSIISRFFPESVGSRP